MPLPKVVCLCVGDKYPLTYVERLYKGLRAHTQRPFILECVTQGRFAGWWNKLLFFAPKERLIYLDLDLVIVGNVDFLFDYNGPFCIWKDPWAAGFNSSVMSIGAGFGDYIKEGFLADPEKAMSAMNGDQDFISRNLRAPPDLWPGGKVKSYKADHLEDGPKEAAIVVFHGDPKPHAFDRGWVHESWV